VDAPPVIINGVAIPEAAIAQEALIRTLLELQVESAEPTDEECGRVYAARFDEGVPYPNVALPRIREMLRARAWSAAAARYVAALARNAHIEGLSLALGRAADGC
jgi:hypothetical protein